MSKQPSFRDLTELSAYLDGELNASARKKLKKRLAHDPNLAAALDDLRLSRTVLRRTPQRRAPRNFTLSRQMVAKRPPMPRLVPALNYASLAAMLLFIFSFLGPIGFGGSMANEAMAPAPMMAMEEPVAEEPVMEMAAEPSVAADSAMEEAPAEEPAAPAAEAPAAEEEMPAAEVGEAEGENLAETELATAPAAADEEGVDAEKTYMATALPTPTIIPTPVTLPQAKVEPAPLLTAYQRILIILFGGFVILSWALRRMTFAQWQKKS